MHRRLDPPAASQVYELTPVGRGLEGPLLALAEWGLAHLMSRGGSLEGHDLPDLLGLAFKMRADPARAAAMDTVIELVIGDATLHLVLADGAVRVARGAATNPAVRVIGPPDAVAQALLGGTLSQDDDRISLVGEPEAAASVLGVFGVTLSPPGALA